MKNNILPYGTSLKPLLQFSNISDSALRKFINEKGIYLTEYKRENIIPLLMSSFISPEEFEKLSDLHITKESKTKITTRVVSVDNQIDMISALEDFDFDSNKDSNFSNYRYIKSPQLTIKNGTYTFPYEINRIDRSQDWTEQETKHKGNIVIRQNGSSLDIELESNHTSNETKQINNKIIKEITTHLKNKDLVSSTEKLQFVKFEDFTNINRFKYMLGFQDLSDKINFIGINDIEFGPDTDKETSPERIEWINEHVKKLIVKGKKLEEIDFIGDSANYDYLIIEKITYNYSFNIEGHTGICIASMTFPSILKKRDPMCPFEFYIDNLKINWSDIRNKKMERKINSFFSDHVSLKKDQLYVKYKM